MNTKPIIRFVSHPAEHLDEVAAISIAFRVERVLTATPRASGGFTLDVHAIAPAYEKDYDVDNPPQRWCDIFEMRRWGLCFATDGAQNIGAALVAYGSPEVDLLEGRGDLAVLWDLRVAPRARGVGIGSLLFAAAEGWARARGCTELKIETQNNNAPACRFYMSRGCILKSVHEGAYPDLPDERQYLWYKALIKGRPAK